MTHIQLDYGKTLEFFDKHELEQQKKSLKRFIIQSIKVMVQVMTFRLVRLTSRL